MAPNSLTQLLIFIALATPLALHQANAADPATALCGRTTHAALCLSTVRADNRAALKTSPNGIATILRDSALATSGSTSAKIRTLLRSANNKHVVESLKSCLEGYGTAIASLKSANFGVINRQTYGTIIAAVSDANDEPRDCELSFQEPPAVPSPISAENQRLREVLATTLEIVNLVVCGNPKFC